MSIIDDNRWSIAGIMLFILGATIALTGFFLSSGGHLLLLIFISLVPLMSSMRLLSRHNLPVLKLLAGVSLTIALFSQAYLIESEYSAALGFVMFLTSAAEYHKDSVSNE